MMPAEDGNRDNGVTGVRTCAVPVYKKKGEIIRGERVGAVIRRKGEIVRGERVGAIIRDKRLRSSLYSARV